jgi:TRAP-type uncharacterized transport system substrate-binding protein
MGRQKIKQLTLGAWSRIFAIFLLVILFLTWMSYHFLQPFPPSTLTMATGREGGTFVGFGERYRLSLAREGIRVKLRQTSGSLENLNLLKDKSRAVEAGFVQGTEGVIEERSGLVSLGGMAYMPLWIFYKGNASYDDLGQLEGKRINVGPEGSAVRHFSLRLLKTAGITGPPTTFLGLSYNESKKALLEGKADVIINFSAPENPMIRDLLSAKDIKLLSLSQAEAYTRRFPDLSHVVLPKGVIDPGKRIPSSEAHLLAPTTNLIIRNDLHPALVYLLLKAAVEIHGGPTLVNKAGEFPSLTQQDDPISEQAQRFYKSGGSWIYSYLPFWAATFIERLTLILIPVGVLLVPLIGIAPWIYTWRNRSKYYPWYRELWKLESEILEDHPVEKTREYTSRLDRIEKEVSRIHTSVAFYDELYFLKEHIRIVRKKLKSFSPPPESKGCELGRDEKAPSPPSNGDLL